MRGGASSGRAKRVRHVCVQRGLQPGNPLLLTVPSRIADTAVLPAGQYGRRRASKLLTVFDG